MTTEVPEHEAATLAAPENTTRVMSTIALVLALAGVAVATYLVREQISVTEGGLLGGMFCGQGPAFDCHSVATSERAWMLGLPTALWGLLFYIGMGGLALATLLFRAPERAAAASIGVIASCVALVFDGYLAWFMVTRIGSVCLLCVATYVVNLLLAVTFWWIERRTNYPSDTRGLFLSWRPLVPKLVVALLVVAGIGTSLTLTVIALADINEYVAEETNEFLAKLSEPPEIDMSLFADQPSLGPANAPLTLVLVSDFQCVYCRALAGHAEKLREELPDQLRLVFLNSPVSPQCNPAIKHETHEDACWLAEIGECAAEQGKFWEYHDLLFRTLPQPEVTRGSVTRYLGSIGLDVTRFQKCFETGVGKRALERDVQLSQMMKLESVPSMVLNGHVRRGGVYPKMLRDVIHTMLSTPVAR